MNLREKQIIRLLVQESINNPNFVLYYIQSKGDKQDIPALITLGRIIKDSRFDSSKNLKCLEEYVSGMPDKHGDEAVIKKLFQQVLNDKITA